MIIHSISPYGHGERIGLNGELRDITDSSVYHLGNGTCTYWPASNGFSTADTYSPFLGGGINPYRYCCGDPINAVDPSGHMSIVFQFAVAAAALIAVPLTGGSSLGLYLGVIGGCLGVASVGLDFCAQLAANNGYKEASQTFAKASSALTVIGAVFIIGDIAAEVGLAVEAARIVEGVDMSTLPRGLTGSEIDKNIFSVCKTRYTIACKKVLAVDRRALHLAVKEDTSDLTDD